VDVMIDVGGESRARRGLVTQPLASGSRVRAVLLSCLTLGYDESDTLAWYEILKEEYNVVYGIRVAPCELRLLTDSPRAPPIKARSGTSRWKTTI
jgi:hypothetical protein